VLEMFGVGFAQIMNIPVMLLCLLGTVLGIFFGAAPGMTSSMGIALVLPITYGMPMEYGMSLILGIYIGSISGGLITAILINIPGTPASVATTFDGHPMALRGEGGRAIRVGTLYSFLGGMLSLGALFFISPFLAKWALKFGPVEYFSIAVFSLTLIASLSGGSIIKGALSALLGVLFTTVGMAPVDSVFRYTFGFHALDAGIQLLPVLVGVFAVMEIIKSAEDPTSASMKPLNYQSKGLGVSWREFKEQFRNFLVSAGIGTGIGILPGLGAAISNLVAYSVSRDSSKHPEKYGTGIIDGLVASETANNAVAGGAMVPLLTMGIPGDAGTAMMLAAFMLHGITPGPLLFATQGKLIYGMFAILIVSNVMMFALQMYGLSFFLKLLKIPRNMLFPIIIVLASVGAFAMNNRVFDIWSILFFGLVGYGVFKFNFPAAPLVLGFVLGKLLEVNFRRGAMAVYGNFWGFFTQPISGTVFAITALFIGYNVYNSIRKYKKAKTAAV
jgi:putative tricarboxylic transport membrane protein